MAAGGALQQQAVLASGILDVGRVFLEVDPTCIFDIAHCHRCRIFDIEMRRFGRKRAAGRQHCGHHGRKA
jgi:hypothetical protein